MGTWMYSVCHDMSLRGAEDHLLDKYFFSRFVQSWIANIVKRGNRKFQECMMILDIAAIKSQTTRVISLKRRLREPANIHVGKKLEQWDFQNTFCEIWLKNKYWMEESIEARDRSM